MVDMAHKLLNFYIFDRKGECLYYTEWERLQPAVDEAEDRKLLFGFLLGMRGFAQGVNPTSSSRYSYLESCS